MVQGKRLILGLFVLTAAMGCASTDIVFPGRFPANVQNRGLVTREIVRRRGPDNVRRWEALYNQHGPEKILIRLDVFSQKALAERHYELRAFKVLNLIGTRIENADRAAARGSSPGRPSYSRALVLNGHITVDFIPLKGRVPKKFVEEFMAKFMNPS